MLQTVIMNVSDVSQPQPQLGDPALLCGVKITAMAGNGELHFYLTSILTFFWGLLGENLSLRLGNIHCCHGKKKRSVFQA